MDLWLTVVGIASFLVGVHVGGWVFYRAGFDRGRLVSQIAAAVSEHPAGKKRDPAP
jgi:hypothetical protein